MLTFLALLGVPEWKALSNVQRRFVRRRCIHPLLTSWQAAMAKTVMGLLIIAGAYWLGAFDRMSTMIVAMLVVIFVTADVFDLVVVARHRQQVVSFIQNHGAEIQSGG